MAMVTRALSLKGIESTTHGNGRQGATKVSDLVVVIMGKKDWHEIDYAAQNL